MAKPCTPHPIAQRVQLFKLQTANVRGQGAGPLAFSWGFKGDILSRERISPLFRAAPAALLSPRPAEPQAFVPLQEIKQKGDLERGLLLF